MLKRQKILRCFFNTEIDEVLGDTVVEGVRAVNNQTQEKQDIPVTGVFIAIGHTPNTDIFKEVLDMDESAVFNYRRKIDQNQFTGGFCSR